MSEPTVNGNNDTTTAAPPKTDQVIQEIDDSKPQILWQDNTIIVVMPLDKMPRFAARGFLLEAHDLVSIRYLNMQRGKNSQKSKIIVPGFGAIKRAVGNIFGK